LAAFLTIKTSFTGALVVTGLDGVIQFAAVSEGFDLASSDLLGKHIDVLLGEGTKRVVNAVEERAEPTTPILLRSKILGQWLTCTGHKQENLRVYEFELSPLREVNIPSVKFMNERHDSLESVRTDSLGKTFPELAQMSFSGVLGVKIEGNWLFWTRKEIIRSIRWAGNPHKTANSEDEAQRLTPRLSFEAFSESVRGTSLSWQQYEVDAADKLKQTILYSLGKSKKHLETGMHQFEQALGVEIAQDVAELTQNFEALNFDAV
jgi:hypothetical protein